MTNIEMAVQAAYETLCKGGVILYPTDTVWGIGCDATNSEAVSKVYEIKNRIDSKAMIVLSGTLNDVWRYTEEVPAIAEELFTMSAEEGSKPLTLVLPKGCGVASNLLPEEKTIAIRIPQHEFCQRLLRKFRRAIVSTSANISGEKTPARFAEISPVISGRVDYVVPAEFERGATCKPSSIIAIGSGSEVTILRP